MTTERPGSELCRSSDYEGMTALEAEAVIEAKALQSAAAMRSASFPDEQALLEHMEASIQTAQAAHAASVESSKQALGVMYAFGQVEGLEAVELGTVSFE